MHTHGFYLALAYGVGAALLAAEAALLCLRWRKARQAQQAQAQAQEGTQP